MNTLLLAPHNDDEALFAAFTLLRYRPHVIVCFRSATQDSPHYPGGPITAETRERETDEAIKLLGCTWHQWPSPDNRELDANAPTWLAAWLDPEAPFRADAVFAPAVEKDGHPQHNAVGQLALDVFGDLVRPYLTYHKEDGHGWVRSKGTEVEFEPSWPRLKMRALGHYASQIASPATRKWFVDDPIREYVP